MRGRSGIAALLLVLGAPFALAQEPATVAPPQDSPVVPPALVVETPERPADQSNPAILTIDQEELFSASAWGMRVQADLDQRGSKIAEENERLAVQFSNEEEQLTALRSTLSPEEFRKRADEFDKRVVEVRRQRDSVGRELQDHVEEERAAFFRAALPVLAQVMKERGAVVVLDQRSIFVSAQSADITATMIERIDREIGAGPAEPAQKKTPEKAPPVAPATPPQP
jgi:Skp family chaperone for outer membrane proteins